MFCCLSCYFKTPAQFRLLSALKSLWSSTIFWKMRTFWQATWLSGGIKRKDLPEYSLEGRCAAAAPENLAAEIERH